jgi:hypothetical protein
MKAVKMMDFREKLTPVSIWSPTAEDLVRGILSTNRLKSSFHIVEVQGCNIRVFSAGDGLVRLMRYMPAGVVAFAIVSRVKILRQAVRWSYFQMTRLRLASESCSVSENIQP